jgi:hypothetical protein
MTPRGDPESSLERLIRPPLLGMAGAGLLLSAWAHLAALNGRALQLEHPWLFSLHLLMFVAFVPGLVLRILSARRRINADALQSQRLAGILAGIPLALRILVGALIVYAAANFLIAGTNLPNGSVAEDNGAYSIRLRTGEIESIDRAAYLKIQASQLRAFSGHWLLFFTASIAMLWPDRGARTATGAPNVRADAERRPGLDDFRARFLREGLGLVVVALATLPAVLAWLLGLYFVAPLLLGVAALNTFILVQRARDELEFLRIDGDTARLVMRRYNERREYSLPVNELQLTYARAWSRDERWFFRAKRGGETLCLQYNFPHYWTRERLSALYADLDAQRATVVQNGSASPA